MPKAWLSYVVMAVGVTLLASSGNAAPIKLPLPAPLKLDVDVAALLLEERRDR